MTDDRPNPATHHNGEARPGIPAARVADHPTSAIPLPDHGFESLDLPVREMTDVPAAEVISQAAVLLMSASAEKLGLSPGNEPDLDLEEARKLVTALAGLVAASQDYLGRHLEPLRDGVRTLQTAFREASAFPDAPGEGPGEKFLP